MVKNSTLNRINGSNHNTAANTGNTLNRNTLPAAASLLQNVRKETKKPSYMRDTSASIRKQA